MLLRAALLGGLLILFCARAAAATSYIARAHSGGECDLNGDWVVVTFRNFDDQSFGLVSVVQSGQQLSVQCQDKGCGWESAQGSVDESGVAMAVTTSGGATIKGVIHATCEAITTGIDVRASANWLRVNPDIKRAHLVFMTHLDVGYTLDTSMDVLELYRAQWFPKAYTTIGVLPDKFRWTTHPWLVLQLLNNATGTVTAQDIVDLRSHLADGSIQYHAGPFNMQSEMYSAGLYSYALSLSRQLDNMTAKTEPTITLSQKDVPGITRAAVPLLAAAGIKAIHVGVNDFSTPPAVPFSSPEYFGSSHVFRWHDPASNTSVLAYYASSYSQGSAVPEMIVRVPGFDEALVFVFHVDNTGPQDPGQVNLAWDAAAMVFPNAAIEASSLDAFTRNLLASPAVDSLPVVTSELGDTWIYGCSSDPAKVRHYRALMRARDAAIAAGTMDPRDPRVEGFSRNLAKIGEHTWGNNEGTLFTVNYTNAYFDANFHQGIFQEPLSSFVDQRGYIDTALNLLVDHPLRPALVQAVAATDPYPRSWAGYTPTPISTRVQCGGGLQTWVDSAGTVWVQAPSQPAVAVASMYYVTHSEEDFVSFIRNYSLVYLRDESVNLGFDKYGLAASGGMHSETQAIPVQLGVRATPEREGAEGGAAGGCDVLVNFTFPQSLQRTFGAPASVTMSVLVNALSTASTENVKQEAGSGVACSVDMQWDGKRPTRMAESIWLTVAPGANKCGAWELGKIGGWVSPVDVVVNGSRNTHAVDPGVRLRDSQGAIALEVTSLDAPVVATTERNPVVFNVDSEYVDTSRGMHFSLFNNAWNTNYPVWAQDTSDRFRFNVNVHPNFCA